MDTLEIYRNHKNEIIEQTINLLPNALRGDLVNRTFFVKENNGKIEVDYFVYMGQVSKGENCFFSVKDHETPDPEDYGYENFDEMDFLALGWDERISEAIDQRADEI